ncbi:type III PLP-dependent enzyme [Actinopolyspora mortivallis]|uniref:ornithine decarboxylase n=1 Tax=Actinopolyspora mortivallis TaxID=33906 RepID=A0A2T0GUY2_ACTMO|nr:type III PLP-dependent enzyme [Actinopolyspora mortivallis]PRW62911.1 ornithine decarboxylase [Actinopolyspora mortivallis]
MTDLSATNAVTDRPSGAAATEPRRVGDLPAVESASVSARRYLDREQPATPCLALDLAVVRARHERLRTELPQARICYAVKANPDPRVLTELVALGSSFDVASPGEIDLCLRQGAAAESLSYGNTIKKPADIAHAHATGVRLFATDSRADLENIAVHAPGARVFCRIAVDDTGSRTPFGRKFGCSPAEAARLLERAEELGLEPYGVSFHIGSQQLSTEAWEHGIAAAAGIFRSCGTRAGPHMLNLGGGLPATYTQPTPELGEYTRSMETALRKHFGDHRPELFLEPGRHLVADAGVLRSEVVLVSEDSTGRCRWIYLDAGRYNGLAETEGEAITYRLRTNRDGDPVGPVVLAGPTCDGDDVLYQHTPYELPVTLRGGDTIDLLSAGAYTASYSSVGFNGFAPLTTYCFDSTETTERA